MGLDIRELVKVLENYMSTLEGEVVGGEHLEGIGVDVEKEWLWLNEKVQWLEGLSVKGKTELVGG